jgi:Zn-dependent protease
MNESFHLGRIAGIRVGANWTVLLMAGLVAWSVGAIQLPASAPGYRSGAYVAASIAVAILFFASLLAHELAHAVLARRREVGIEGIVLWMLGGVSRFTSEPEDWKSELVISVAGPATSLVLGGLFLGASVLSAGLGAPTLCQACLAWLGWINALLAVFNLLPAFPLDGGRVLRSALWARRRDKASATGAAARVGRGFGFVMVGLGILGFFVGAGLSGIWLALIGWFIAGAAGAEARASVATTELAGWRVADVMTPEPLTVPVWVPLDRLVREGVLGRGLSTFPVEDWTGAFAGLVTSEQIQRVPPEHLAGVSVGQVAIPAGGCLTCAPGDPLAPVALQLAGAPGRRAIVLAEGKVLGIVAPSDVHRTRFRPPPVSPTPLAG